MIISCQKNRLGKFSTHPDNVRTNILRAADKCGTNTEKTERLATLMPHFGMLPEKLYSKR